MSGWPPNPYLQQFLASPEGQVYLDKYGNLEAWKRRHLLDDPGGGPDILAMSTDYYLMLKKSGLVPQLFQAEPEKKKDDKTVDDPWFF